MEELQRVYDLIMPRLQASEDLEKRADDQSLTTKAATDSVTLHLVKVAATGPLAKGLMYGAGIAAPVTAGGAYLINRAGNESRKTTEDIRNKALQAAAGIAAIGGGLYAMHRQTGKNAQVRTASVQEAPTTLIDKLATVAYLDVLFEDQRQNGEAHVQAKAAECQLLNAEHGVDVLRQLLP